MPTRATKREVVTTWFGAFVVEDGAVVRSATFPDEPDGIADRVRLRRSGSLASEEEELVRTDAVGHLVSTDRRLVALGVELDDDPGAYPDLTAFRPTVAGRRLRDVLLDEADRALRDAWDPAVHLEEAVRAMEDLDRTINLIGERLVSWAGRDSPRLPDVPDERVRAIARDLAAEPGASAEPVDRLPGLDPALEEGRRGLAALYLAAEQNRTALERSLEAAVPRRAPNLAALLGPLLAARMIAQAGGLDRLGRLPASTIQVLGAERAFFEHLRGRAPPPRHGLLFLHPTIQGAPKRLRGKLSRALAGKAAIAARRDVQGSPNLPALATAYAARAADVRRIPSREHRRRRGERDPTPST
jgi:nucleolar protein 56